MNTCWGASAPSSRGKEGLTPCSEESARRVRRRGNEEGRRGCYETRELSTIQALWSPNYDPDITFMNSKAIKRVDGSKTSYWIRLAQRDHACNPFNSEREKTMAEGKNTKIKWEKDIWKWLQYTYIKESCNTLTYMICTARTDEKQKQLNDLPRVWRRMNTCEGRQLHRERKQNKQNTNRNKVNQTKQISTASRRQVSLILQYRLHHFSTPSSFAFITIYTFVYLGTLAIQFLFFVLVLYGGHIRSIA